MRFFPPLRAGAHGMRNGVSPDGIYQRKTPHRRTGAVHFAASPAKRRDFVPYRRKRTLFVHFLFLLLDHSADHFAADGTGFLGSKVAVIAFL